MLATQLVFDIGDFSGDGHDKSAAIWVRCNLSADEIAAADGIPTAHESSR